MPPTAGEALGLAAAWGGVLLVAAVVASRLAPGPRESPAPVVLLAYHAVYALGFGVWIRITWIT